MEKALPFYWMPMNMKLRNDQFRGLIYGNYRIVYRIEKKQISILTIRHGNQILPTNEILP
jgi:toxin ParE1/3/4